jgi:hypothetical protein
VQQIQLWDAGIESSSAPPPPSPVHQIAGSVPERAARNLVLDAMVAGWPDNLRVLVLPNGTVGINLPTPRIVEWKLPVEGGSGPEAGARTFRVAFESHTLPDDVLRRKFAVGNAAIAPDVVSAGHRLWVLDVAAFSPAEATVFRDSSKLVELRYRRFSLNDWPVAEAGLATLCEPLSLDGVTAALSLEAELRRRLGITVGAPSQGKGAQTTARKGGAVAPATGPLWLSLPEQVR